VSECVANYVDSTSASLRNAFIAILAWLVLEVAPQALAAAWRELAHTLGG
jgi:hypothetical protein